MDRHNERWWIREGDANSYVRQVHTVVAGVLQEVQENNTAYRATTNTAQLLLARVFLEQDIVAQWLS